MAAFTDTKASRRETPIPVHPPTVLFPVVQRFKDIDDAKQNKPKTFDQNHQKTWTLQALLKKTPPTLYMLVEKKKIQYLGPA